MSNLVFPTLPGLDIKVTRTSVWSTEVLTAESGKEQRAAWWSSPRYRYTLNLNFVRQGGFSAKTLSDEAAALMQFFTDHRGAWDSFLFTDPYESSVTGKQFGTGNGSSVSFQLVDGVGVPVTETNGIPTIYRADWQGSQQLYSTPRTNFCPKAEALDHAAWINIIGGAGTNPTVTPDYDVGPDGNMTADRVQFSLGAGTTINDFSFRRTPLMGGLSVGQPVIVSFWAKSNGAPITLAVQGGSISSGNATVALTPTMQRFTCNLGNAENTGGGINIGLRGTITPGAADVTITKVQAEQNSLGLATAFIPTDTTAVTVTDCSTGWTPAVYRTDWADPVPSNVSLHAFGDSITFGYGSATPVTTNGFVYLYAGGKGLALTNHAVAADQVADQINDVYSLSVGASQASLVFLGTNDHRYYGINPTKKTIFTDCYRDAMAWLCLPATAKLTSRAGGVAYAGTWADANLFSSNISKQTAVNGSTATFTATGDVIYVSMTVELGGGTYTIKVDGVTQGTYSIDPGAAPLTNNGVAIASRLHRFTGFTTGAHTVVITKTDATAAPVYFNWAAGRVSASGAPGPVVVTGNLNKLGTGGWGYSNASNLIEYNNAISGVVSQLVADGLTIKLADIFSLIDPAADLGVDNLHPNDFGHHKLSLAFTGVLTTWAKDGTITFASAPVSNATLMWTGSYFRRVRFDGDDMELERIVDKAWDGKTIKLISVK